MFTVSDVLEELRKAVKSKTQKSVSVQLGFTPQFINDVVRGRREVSAELAKSLGYERKVYFVRIGK